MLNFTQMIKVIFFASVFLAGVGTSNAVMAQVEIPVTKVNINIIHVEQCVGCTDLPQIPIVSSAPVANIPGPASIDSISQSSTDNSSRFIPLQTSSSSASDLGNLAPAAGGDQNACSAESHANGVLERLGLFAGGAPTDASCVKSPTDNS